VIEDQQEGEEENNDILHRGIESWKKHFGYAVREGNGVCFQDII
jgi:hypothetical protein